MKTPKTMIKKLIKLCVVCFLIGAVVVIAAFFTLKKMYPPSKLKTIAQNYVSQKLQREFSFDSISFTWIGFTLTNAALSENHTFQEGTFAKADKLTAHVAVKPLLKRRIEISTIEAEGLQVNIISQKDGTFNFDTLISSQEDDSAATQESVDASQTTPKEPFVITAQQIKLTDCDLIYQNEQTQMRTALNNLNIEIINFDLDKPFETKLKFTTDISRANQPDMRLPVTVQFTTFLAGLQLQQAYATITTATARYKTIQFDLHGEVKDFKSPSVDLTGSLAGFNNTVLSELAPGLPNFTLPTLHLSLKANANLDAQTATISQAKLSVQDSTLTTQGTVSWNTPTIAYNLSGSLTAIITKLMQMTDSWDNFNPAGTLTATFKATDKKDYADISGNILLKDASFIYNAFPFTQINGSIVLASLANISSPSLTGKFNGEDFTGSFSYQTLPDVVNFILNLKLDKLTLTKFSNGGTSSASSQAQDLASAGQSSGTSLPMNLQAKVTVGEIKIPYFQTNGLTVDANLTNITDKMEHTNGSVNFTLQPGKITNLDDFIKDSKIAKILLLPVAVIKKVSGFLQLNLFPVDDGNGTTISFMQGEGNYTFTDGMMNIDKTVFNSSVTNITATGTANFQTDALDMKAKATLLTQAAPVAFKITGTMNNPKGKLDVVNTVTSVVGGILNGTAVKSATSGAESLTQETTTLATDAVKDTVSTATDLIKGIGNLFKKKDNPSEKEQE